MLWVAAEKDAVISLAGARRSSALCGADFVSIPGAGHNLVMEKDNAQTAGLIDAWLTRRRLQSPRRLRGGRG